MDARRFFSALACCAWLGLISTEQATGQTLYRAESANFTVTAPDRNLAKQVATLAESYRSELAVEWLGRTLEAWREKCPIVVELAPLPGGETSFLFVGPPGSSEPTSWQMRVFGPPDRILDSVLPHEVTHTIFATHFRRPLPRWADEGACTTVEHESEREKNHRMLINFLTAKPSRGIPFNRMFTMKQYPHDILPLYAQGHSLARYLIHQGGKRHFIDYIQAGLDREQDGRELEAWTEATRQFYGHQDLSDLQLAWVSWVHQGSPDVVSPSVTTRPNAAPATAIAPSQLAAAESSATPAGAILLGEGTDSWYRQQMVAAKAHQPIPARPADWSSGDRAGVEVAAAKGWFAPGSTARSDLAIFERVAPTEPVNHMWRATPVPAGTASSGTVWR